MAIGFATHDLGVLQVRGESRPLEPGLYFPANDTTIPEEYRGIGIRIEDDVLVTAHRYLRADRFCGRGVDA